MPLVASGLDLVGLDISQTAVGRLAQRIPARAQDLVHGDLSALPADATYPLVIAIQVFQHGTKAHAVPLEYPVRCCDLVFRCRCGERVRSIFGCCSPSSI